MSFRVLGTLHFAVLVYFSLPGQLVKCDSQVLRYVSQVPPPAGAQTRPFPFNSTNNNATELRDTMQKFATAGGLCARGMWALYNFLNWGEGQEANTTVISMLSTDADRCYAVSPAQLRQVKSINFLGNTDINNPGITMFTQPFFLGGMWNTLGNTTGKMIAPGGVDAPNGMTLGSFGATGTLYIKLCVDSSCMAPGVCIDMTKSTQGKMFMVKNVPADRSASRPWPVVIRGLQISTALSICQSTTSDPDSVIIPAP